MIGRRFGAALAGALAAVALAGCGGDDEGTERAEPPPPAEAPPAQDPPTEPPADERPSDRERLARADGAPEVTTLVSGLEVPWDLAFLPDGRALLTERPGRVRLLSAKGELAP